MSRSSQMAWRVAYPALTLMLSALMVRGEIVYDNSTGDLTTRFNPGLYEVGDEILLGGTARLVTTFIFQYYGENFSGNEEARVRFYKNDGPNSPSGPAEPGTLLFDSGLFSIIPTNRATLHFTGLSVLVPDSFTWTVQFSGIAAGESAGVDVYSPPTVGFNYDDYWDNTGSGWQLRTNGVPLNFAARIEAVPEPSSVALIAVCGLATVVWTLRRGRGR
jgi:hypothetical protein